MKQAFAATASPSRGTPAKTGEPGSEPRRVAIAGGYTAGHVNTGLEIAREYQRSFGPASILFIGTEHGFETRLVPPTGFRLELVSGSPVANRGRLEQLTGTLRSFVGVLQARRLLKAEGIQLVVGVGSYSSAATLLAARQLGIRSALHEANERLGLANRLAARFVDRIYLGSSSALASVEGTATWATPRALVTGNPVRREILARPCNAPVRDGTVRLLVLGGSLGSAFLNDRAPNLLGRLVQRGIRIEVAHQGGDTNLEAIRAHYQREGIRATVAPYIDDMAELYGSAHFAVTSGGAISLAELAACGLPALVVPLEGAAHDHQLHNAAAHSRGCGALWVREAEWDPSALADAIAAQLQDVDRWAELSRRAKQRSRPQAATELVEDCEAMMTTQHGRRARRLG